MDSIVSIIIPVYNAEKTLRRCVESLVYGVEKNIEVILVDDCSMDGSWKLCQQLQSEFKSVKSIQNKKNSGVSYTRNHGLNEVNSPYVMFVDSDDWVSKYFVSSLLYAAKIYKDGQILCGFHYIDRLTNNKIDYQWNSKNHKDVIVIQGVSLFDAVDKIMLQNVWNKIFIYDIIREHNIRFDEMQNMGEDFQFVLEYMVAADLHKCIVLNQPLYYYVRANQTSLMSKYGWASEKQEIQRLKLLRTLCEGDTKVLQRRLEKQIVDTKENLAYHVVRTKHKSTKEKITRIEEIFDDGRGKQYYKKQIKIKKRKR